MAKVGVVLLLIVTSPLLVTGQPAPQLPSGGYPAVTTQGDTNPEVVSDLNAQLIWLLAASPSDNDADYVTSARKVYQRAAFGVLNARNQEELNAILRDLRARHDAYAADYNALVPSMNRDDVWRQYRDFRSKVNDLVAETIRAINDLIPDSAEQFHSTIEGLKHNITITAYRSSADRDYDSNPRTAATGFAMIQGAISYSPAPASDSPVSWTFTTGVVVGMVPGCRGKVRPVVVTRSPDVEVPSSKTLPWEYVNFQYTGKSTHGSNLQGITMICEMPPQ